MKLSNYVKYLVNEGPKPDYTQGIQCPQCQSEISKITDKRNYADRIWRRRECSNKHRYTTLETYGTETSNPGSEEANVYGGQGKTTIYDPVKFAKEIPGNDPPDLSVIKDKKKDKKENEKLHDEIESLKSKIKIMQKQYNDLLIVNMKLKKQI